MAQLFHTVCARCRYPLSIEIDRPDQASRAIVGIYRRYQPPHPRQLAARCPRCGADFRGLQAADVLRQLGQMV